MKKKYFGTDGIRGKANEHPMTAEFALKLGMATGIILKNKNNKKKHKVVIGKDTRISCYMLEAALTAGLNAMGIDVFLIGPIPTPGVAMLTRSMRCDLGIVISASHNPYYDNGIKFFDEKGIKFPDSIEQDIEEIIDNKNLNEFTEKEGKIGRAWRSDNYIYQQRYIEYVKSSFPRDLDLEGISIVLDTANGAAYKVAPTVFMELGVDKMIKIGYEPTGMNINNNCGSTKPEELQKAVLKFKTDLGIAFDGDADRIILVDENGKIVDGDKIIALVATSMFLNGKLNKNTVVVTKMSNFGFEKYFQSLGVTVIRTDIGDRYVTEKMRENNYNVGGEQSGHIVLGDFSTTGDGICCALQVLSILKRKRMENPEFKFSELFNLYETTPQILNNIKYENVENNPLEKQEVIDIIAEYEKKLEGIGRLLIRKSGTEPLIRVMVECTDENLLNEAVDKISYSIEKYC